MFFWKSQLAIVFWAWFQVEFYFLFVASLSWKGPLMGDAWMVKVGCKLLCLLVHLFAIGVLCKHHCNVIFNEVALPLTLEDLWSFKHELALLLIVHLSAFCCDVESLLWGPRLIC
jgi:hypothetical protein